jgi:hypothetical protein
MSLLFSHPIKKLTLLVAFGGGYVLGAKAGRERYEQIRQTANQVKDDPRVQQAASRAEDLVRDAAAKVGDDPRIKDVVSRAEDIVRDAGLHTSQDSSDDAPKATVTQDSSTTPPPAPTPAPPTPSDVPKPDVPKPDVPKHSAAAPPADVNPLTADEYVAMEDEIVYSSGPDIEESIDELADVDSPEQPLTERQGDQRDGV